MDHLLHDLLDLRVPVQQFVDERGRLRIDRLLASPALAANLAFHEAWRAALGTRPTRIDFEDFARRAPGGALKALAVWSPACSAALDATLVTCSPILLAHEARSAMGARAGEAYQRTLATVSGGEGGGRALALLAAKLAHRFGSTGAQGSDWGSADGLVRAYAALVTSDPRLRELEAWSGPGSSTAKSMAAAHPPPSSVTEYYERVWRAAKALRLPWRCPLTGFEVSIELPLDKWGPCLSAWELVALPLMRNGYLWRQDGGGALLLGARAAEVVPPGDSSFKFRRCDVPASALVAAALPPGLYSRVAVVAGTRAEADAVAAAVPRALDRPQPDIVSLIVGATGDKVQVVRRDAGGAGGVSDWRFWMPSATGGDLAWAEAVWAVPLSTSMLSTHLLHGLPRHWCGRLQQQQQQQQQAAGAAGVLLYQQMVARYAVDRKLADRKFHTATVGSPGRTGEVVLIDTRANVWSVLSLLITLDNLRTREWAVTVFCSQHSRNFMELCLRPQVPKAWIETLPELNAAFDMQRYNALLKSPGFWRRLMSSRGDPRRVLLVQDDGLLVRPGLDDDDEVLRQLYVGAPWALGPPEYRRMLEAAGVPADLVGNGGLSLRCPRTMLRLCEEAGPAATQLFNGNSQPTPEDVFFAAALQRSGLPGCPRAVAERFSFEMTAAPPTSTPYGLHKPWAYLPAGEVQRAFDRAFETNSPTSIA